MHTAVQIAPVLMQSVLQSGTDVMQTHHKALWMEHFCHEKARNVYGVFALLNGYKIKQ